MPNQVGGSQHHPAYNPKVKVDRKTQILVGDALYTKKGNDIVVWYCDGGEITTPLTDKYLPKVVQAHFKQKRKRRR